MGITLIVRIRVIIIYRINMMQFVQKSVNMLNRASLFSVQDIEDICDKNIIGVFIRHKLKNSTNCKCTYQRWMVFIVLLCIWEDKQKSINSFRLFNIILLYLY